MNVKQIDELIFRGILDLADEEGTLWLVMEYWKMGKVYSTSRSTCLFLGIGSVCLHLLVAISFSNDCFLQSLVLKLVGFPVPFCLTNTKRFRTYDTNKTAKNFRVWMRMRLLFVSFI